MKFQKLPLTDAYLIELECHFDERGFFARTYCKDQFLQHGLIPHLEQCSLSYNTHPYTVRGMHFQIQPYQEIKIISCIQGSIFDVIIDLRKDSRTYMQWVGVELSAKNNLQLYVPEGFAHGFQTLESDSKVYYQISSEYHPQAARGVRWDDPAFNIQWPKTKNVIISERDRTYPDFIYEQDTCNRC